MTHLDDKTATVNLAAAALIRRLDGEATGEIWDVLYRGGWCPYCSAQLRAFRRAADQLADLDIRVVALSVDDGASTRQTIAEHGLEFPAEEQAA